MKPKIKKIDLDLETIQNVREILNSSRSNTAKYSVLRKYGIRRCLTCGSIATKQLIYQVGDREQRAQKIEHYCDKCISF